MLDHLKNIYSLLFFALICSINTGCCSKYDYNTYIKQAESALIDGDYQKARDLISFSYNQEKNIVPKDMQKITWLFYRLGVIAELKKETKLAKGYYWGDQVKAGFYSPIKKTAWLAETGWKHLDDGNPPRSFAVIMELELMDPPEETKEKPIKVTKKQIKRKPAYVPAAKRLDVVPRHDNPITYPPEKGAKGLFKVRR